MRRTEGLATLVQSVGADDEFAAFYRHSYPKLCSLLRARVSDASVAEDIAQEAMLVVRRRWATVRDLDQPEGWLMKVAVRLLYRAEQMTRRRTEVERSAPVTGISGDHSTTLSENDHLYAAIRQLPARRAEVITLHYLLGYPVGDISAIIGTSVAAVRSALSRGRRDLAAILGDDNLDGGPR